MTIVAHKRGGGNSYNEAKFLFFTGSSIRLDCKNMPDVIHIAITKKI